MHVTKEFFGGTEYFFTIVDRIDDCCGSSSNRVGGTVTDASGVLCQTKIQMKASCHRMMVEGSQLPKQFGHFEFTGTEDSKMGQVSFILDRASSFVLANNDNLLAHRINFESYKKEILHNVENFDMSSFGEKSNILVKLLMSKTIKLRF